MPPHSSSNGDRPIITMDQVSTRTVPRTVRRAQLRDIVPLSDTTIYEMEKRGEFPRRFYLTSRCVCWDLGEVEQWLEERRRMSHAQFASAFPDVRKRKARPVKS